MFSNIQNQLFLARVGNVKGDFENTMSKIMEVRWNVCIQKKLMTVDEAIELCRDRSVWRFVLSRYIQLIITFTTNLVNSLKAECLVLLKFHSQGSGSRFCYFLVYSHTLPLNYDVLMITYFSIKCIYYICIVIGLKTMIFKFFVSLAVCLYKLILVTAKLINIYF